MAAEKSDKPSAETASDTRHVEIVIGDDGCLACDLACVECEYNLRGLPPDGNCPECGSLVRRALLGNILELASSGWLRSLYSGVSMLSWLLPVTLLVTAYSWLPLGFSGLTFSREHPFLTAFLVILVVADLRALALLTRRESVSFAAKDCTIWRKLLRVWAVVAAAAFAAAILAPLIDRQQAWLVLQYVPHVILSLIMLGMFGVTRYLVAILDRTSKYYVSTSVRGIGDPVAIALLAALAILLFQSVRTALLWPDSDFTNGLSSLGLLLGFAGAVGVCFMLLKAGSILSDLADSSSGSPS